MSTPAHTPSSSTAAVASTAPATSPISRSGVHAAGPAALMQELGESISFDYRLAPFDIAGSKAHSAMLAAVGLISEAERAAIHAGLDTVLAEVTAGTFRWDIAQEDVHMNIEAALSARVPAAAKLHTARSRNDQVALDTRLFLRHAADELAGLVAALQRALVGLAEANRAIVLPGYTHLQRGQPVTAAHHLLAHVEMLERDRRRFGLVADEANVCPLGAGALAGTTLPIDRAHTARTLGMVDAAGHPRLTHNSMDAVADRDAHLAFLFACATCGTHLSRLCEDFFLWSTAEFGFVRLPPAYTTGSSLMPQKRNPDACELIRGKAARLQANLQKLFILVKGLPLTYNRDLQEDKPPLFDSFDQLGLSLRVLADMVPGIVFREDRCRAAASDPLLLATDLCDYLVRCGMPFRQAHHAVGHLVAEAEARQLPLPALPDAVVLHHAPLAGADWRDVFDLGRALAARTGVGMPSPAQTDAELARWHALLG